MWRWSPTLIDVTFPGSGAKRVRVVQRSDFLKPAVTVLRAPPVRCPPRIVIAWSSPIVKIVRVRVGGIPFPYLLRNLPASCTSRVSGALIAVAMLVFLNSATALAYPSRGYNRTPPHSLSALFQRRLLDEALQSLVVLRTRHVIFPKFALPLLPAECHG